jgi:hypothetical protein
MAEPRDGQLLPADAAEPAPWQTPKAGGSLRVGLHGEAAGGLAVARQRGAEGSYFGFLLVLNWIQVIPLCPPMKTDFRDFWYMPYKHKERRKQNVRLGTEADGGVRRAP